MQGERSALSLHDRLEGAVLFGIALELADFGHKKRRPWTSFFDRLVEPGGFEPASSPCFSRPAEKKLA